jgi:hypothetical protein
MPSPNLISWLRTGQVLGRVHIVAVFDKLPLT